MDDNNSDKFVGVLIFGLVISIVGNIFLYGSYGEAETNRQIARLIKDLTKDKYDVEATLNECNATLATVQAKPAPAPLACPLVLPMPACPSVPTVVCPAAPEPSPAIAAPAPIATPVPKIIYRYKYIHRHIHYRKPAAKPAEPICEWNIQND